MKEPLIPVKMAKDFVASVPALPPRNGEAAAALQGRMNRSSDDVIIVFVVLM